MNKNRKVLKKGKTKEETAVEDIRKKLRSLFQKNGLFSSGFGYKVRYDEGDDRYHIIYTKRVRDTQEIKLEISSPHSRDMKNSLDDHIALLGHVT